jgi:hypothetical protein
MGSVNYYQLIPEKIIQGFEVVVNILRSEIKGFSTDNLKEVISIIACHIQKNKESAPLKMVYLKKLVPQADKYMKGLIDLGIVLRTGNYIPGEVSYKYKFSPEYDSRYITVSLENAKLIRRIKKTHEDTEKTMQTIHGRSDQIKFLKKLTIDDNWMSFINAYLLYDTNEYDKNLQSAIRIMNGDIFYSVDRTSGRFHSNITNMAKGLRQFLRINGEPLVNIDIKNSQPYLSTLILTNPGKVAGMTKNHAFALLLQSLKVPKSKDVTKYINLVVSGQLYEFLMAEFDKKGLRLTRDETKKQVLRILFDRNRLPENELNRKCKTIFRQLFPNVNKVFNKVRGYKRGGKFISYKRFAILLQTIESYLILEVILKRIYRELPGIIAVTIHDSIMTGAITNQADAIHKIMMDELTSFVGFAPKISLEGNIKVNKERKEGGAFSNQYDATTLVCYTNSIN